MKKVTKFSVLVLMLLTTMIACQKDVLSPNSSAPNSVAKSKSLQASAATLQDNNNCNEGVSFDGSTLVFADHKAYENTYACLQNQIQEAVRIQAEEFKNEGIEENQFDVVAAERGIDPIAHVLDAFERQFDGYVSFRTNVQGDVKRWLTEEDAAAERNPNKNFTGDLVARTLANAKYITKIQEHDISFYAEGDIHGLRAPLACVPFQFKSQWFYPSGGKKILGKQWIQDWSIFGRSFGGYVMGSTEAYVKVDLWFASYWVAAIFSSTQTCKGGSVYKPGCTNRIGVTSACQNFPFASMVLEFFIPNEGIRALPGTGHYKTSHSAFGFTGSITN